MSFLFCFYTYRLPVLSIRNLIRKIWPYQLPNMDPEMLARLVFCFENHPEREDGIISGAQDAIGICMPGLCRWYDKLLQRPLPEAIPLTIRRAGM